MAGEQERGCAVNFDESFVELIDSEGGYSDDRSDPGNWTSGVVGKGAMKGTKFGIAANTYGHLDIAALTLAEAKAIYKADYWDIWQFDGLSAEMPDSIKYELFDAAVNCGESNARKFLQRAVSVADDGKIGKVTIRALDAALLANGVARVERWIIAEHLAHKTKLSTWPRYGRGWANRAVKSLKNI